MNRSIPTQVTQRKSLERLRELCHEEVESF